MKLFLTGLLLGTCRSTRERNKLGPNEDFRYLLEPGIKFWIEEQRDRSNEIVRFRYILLINKILIFQILIFQFLNEIFVF